MAYLSLSRRDLNVLEKIKDPESDPSQTVHVDSTLPRDPYIRDAETYNTVAQQEREIILSIQQLETAQHVAQDSVIEGYRNCITRLGILINEHVNYSSARNNRAQALRRLYGDSMLLGGPTQPAPQALIRDPDQNGRLEAARTVLGDLDRAISLLTPVGLFPKLSPQAAKTLSSAHTQRAAIYLMTSKLMSSRPLSLPESRREANWTKIDFEENASRDFAMGGRYGNEIARALAVSTNPTAKLCGQMVREAMKKEYGHLFAEGEERKGDSS